MSRRFPNLRRPGRAASLLPAICLLLAACAFPGRFETMVVGPDGGTLVVNGRVLKGLAAYAEDDTGVPLERVLLQAGYQAVERLIVTGPDGTRREFDWTPVAGGARWQKDGTLTIGGETLRAARLDVEAPALLGQVQARITDLAPTAAAALGLPAPAASEGWVLAPPSARHVLLLYLDGLGYVRFSEARRDGLAPALAALGEPRLGLTAYPPSTNVASAALLTGAPPAVNGADRQGVRQTETETLFDVAAAAGRRVVAVEGQALAFNLRAAELTLSGDRDGNGSTDDNVLANALAVLRDGMPDVLLVHFHGIDDAGHTYGPGSPEESAAIVEVDAAIGQILAALPPDTLILAFADHGMHAVEEEGKLGNHGTLSARDMFIPIWVVLGPSTS